MAADLVQPPARRQMRGDIGLHRLDHRETVGRVILAPQPVGPDQRISGVVIGGAADHHPIQPLIEQRLRLIQRGNPAIDADREFREALLHLQHQRVIERRDFAVFLGRKALQPGLARMHHEMRDPGRRHGFDETRQHLGRGLIVDPDAAFHRHRHGGFLRHGAHAIGHQRGPFHQHGTEAARLHPV